MQGRFGIPLNRKTVLALSIGFTVAFTLISWLVTAVVRQQPFSSLFERGQPLPQQVLFGLLIGAAVATVGALVVLKAPPFAGFRNLVREILSGIQPTRLDLLIVALGAGWGEELLFRGTIQPLIGIWWTSLLFTLVHGAVDPRSRGKMAFSVFVFVLSGGLGFLAETVGLVAAMVAHATYDLVVLLALQTSLVAKRA